MVWVLLEDRTISALEKFCAALERRLNVVVHPTSCASRRCNTADGLSPLRWLRCLPQFEISTGPAMLTSLTPPDLALLLLGITACLAGALVWAFWEMEQQRLQPLRSRQMSRRRRDED